MDALEKWKTFLAIDRALTIPLHPMSYFYIIVSFALAAFILYRPGEIKSLFSWMGGIGLWSSEIRCLMLMCYPGRWTSILNLFNPFIYFRPFRLMSDSLSTVSSEIPIVNDENVGHSALDKIITNNIKIVRVRMFGYQYCSLPCKARHSLKQCCWRWRKEAVRWRNYWQEQCFWGSSVLLLFQLWHKYTMMFLLPRQLMHHHLMTSRHHLIWCHYPMQTMFMLLLTWI